MKVAFATKDGKNIDEHFGRAGTFAIYEFRAEDSVFHFIELRTFADGMDRSVTDTREMGPLHDAAVESKVDRLSDCKLVYLTQIGGPSAARLVKRGLMPMKVAEPMSIEKALEQLGDTIRKSPPPWLRKALKTL